MLGAPFGGVKGVPRCDVHATREWLFGRALRATLVARMHRAGIVRIDRFPGLTIRGLPPPARIACRAPRPCPPAPPPPAPLARASIRAPPAGRTQAAGDCRLDAVRLAPPGLSSALHGI